jgi:DNA-binding winged helix-turn-helix (wHTH) protein
VTKREKIRNGLRIRPSIEPGAGRADGGILVLDVDTRKLYREDGSWKRLRPQAHSILLLLLSHPGEVVKKEKLRAALWDSQDQPVYVESVEGGIRKAIFSISERIRELGEDVSRYIEVIPRGGARFIGDVERFTDERPPTSVAESSTPKTGEFNQDRSERQPVSTSIRLPLSVDEHIDLLEAIRVHKPFPGSAFDKLSLQTRHRQSLKFIVTKSVDASLVLHTWPHVVWPDSRIPESTVHVPALGGSLKRFWYSPDLNRTRFWVSAGSSPAQIVFHHEDSTAELIFELDGEREG